MYKKNLKINLISKNLFKGKTLSFINFTFYINNFGKIQLNYFREDYFLIYT